jgi:hypothetical protein
MAESHTPPLEMNQLFVYLRDHLLINKKCRYTIINPLPPFSSSRPNSHRRLNDVPLSLVAPVYRDERRAPRRLF